MTMKAYDVHVLWTGRIPYNSSRSKYEDMKITKNPKPVVLLNFIRWVFGKKLMSDNHGHDDYVDRMVIQKGKAKPTYEDVPIIRPYVVRDAKTSVVVAPGGGFCDRSDKAEGSDIAAVFYGLWHQRYFRGISRIRRSAERMSAEKPLVDRMY